MGTVGVILYRDVYLQYVLDVWLCYSDLCWWSDNCHVFQGARGPDGPTGEMGLEGKKVKESDFIVHIHWNFLVDI